MASNLIVNSQISNTLQQVKDQNNTNTSLYLSSKAVYIDGTDFIDSIIPFTVRIDTSHSTYGPNDGNTLGRLIRLENKTSTKDCAFDIGIDKDGNLFINGNASLNNLLKITPSGQVKICGDLVVQGKIIYSGCPTMQTSTQDKSLQVDMNSKTIGIES